MAVEETNSPEEGVKFDLSAGQDPVKEEKSATHPAPNEEGVNFDLTEKKEEAAAVQDTAQDVAQVDVKEESPETETVENTAEVKEGEITIEQTAKETEPEVNKESSLNSEVTTEPQDITEDQVKDYLSKLRGEEVQDLDTLFKGPVEEDPHIKQLKEWSDSTGLPIEDWPKYQKDYNAMSALESVREYLQIEYPSFTSEELDIEMESYLPSDLDDDREAKVKALSLKKLEVKAKNELNKRRVEFLETASNSNKGMSPEVQEKLKAFEDVQKVYADNQKSQTDLQDALKVAAGATDSIALKLSDDLTIRYNLGDKKNSLVDMYNEMPHWKNQDGSLNHQAIIEDVAFSVNKEAIIQAAFKQGQNSGTEQVIKEDVKNITLSDTNKAGGGTVEANKGPVIEGNALDNFMGKTGMRMKFGKK